MAGKFKYDINPLILKTLWEQAPTPGLDEAISEFNRIHKPVHKSWKPEIKIPSLQINKVYLNGIVVLAFSLLFIYLIFFKGFSGKSEKNEQNIQRVKVLSGPPTTHSSTSSIDNNKEQKNSVIKDSSSARVNTNVKSPVSTSHSTISPDSLVSSQKTKNTPVSIPVDEKSEKKDSIITSSSNDKDSLNVTANQKKKKKKRRKKVESEILEKSPDREEILLPSSTSQEREPEIRP